MAEICPTIMLRPIEDHPPPLENPLNTAAADWRGASTQSTMMTTRKPKMCTTSSKFWIIGRPLAPQMLQM